jgi:uncharacterized membrane protein
MDKKSIKRDKKPNKFFSEQEKKNIVQAIASAEKETSGEIRLHLEQTAKRDPMKRAIQVFYKIGMHKTAQRNGVLLYLATGDHQFAIIGDKGIDELVPDNFWDDIAMELGNYFNNKEFCEGVCRGINKIGEKLKAHFPYHTDDENELPDDISMSDK